MAGSVRSAAGRWPNLSLLRGRGKFTTDLSRYVCLGRAAIHSVFGPDDFPILRRVAAEAIGEALEPC